MSVLVNIQRQTVTGYGLGDLGSISDRDRQLYLQQRVQTGPGLHPGSFQTSSSGKNSCEVDLFNSVLGKGLTLEFAIFGLLVEVHFQCFIASESKRVWCLASRPGRFTFEERASDTECCVFRREGLEAVAKRSISPPLPKKANSTSPILWPVALSLYCLNYQVRELA
jgi:hypothetical protein